MCNNQLTDEDERVYRGLELREYLEWDAGRGKPVEEFRQFKALPSRGAEPEEIADDEIPF